MADVCNDDRYEMIKRVKTRLIERTNIETNPGEMNVIDVILYRFWQLGWLSMIDDYDKLRYCIEYINPRYPFLDSGNPNVRHCRLRAEESATTVLNILLSCGCRIVRLYRGNVVDGKLGEWPAILDDEDWVTKEWIDHLKELEELKNY